MSGTRRANWNHAKIKGIGLPKLFGGSLKSPKTLAEWNNNAEKLLKKNHIQPETFDYLFDDKNGGLNLEKLVGFLNEQLTNSNQTTGQLTDEKIKNYITKNEKIAELKKILMSRSETTVKEVYTNLQKLKRLYRANKAQESAKNKEASTITIKAMRAKWGIGKPQGTNNTYTDAQIKEYAETLQKNFQSISKIQKYGVTVFYNQFKGFKGSIDNPKNWINKLVYNLDIHKEFFEGETYTKDEKENPFYYIFFDEQNYKKTFGKIKSSNEKIQKQEQQE